MFGQIQNIPDVIEVIVSEKKYLSININTIFSHTVHSSKEKNKSASEKRKKKKNYSTRKQKRNKKFTYEINFKIKCINCFSLIIYVQKFLFLTHLAFIYK